MPWTSLVIAGLLEAVWAIGLKLTDGFTKPLPSVLTVISIAASMFLLASAARTIPIGTAYAVWVGIGVVGAVVGGALFFGESMSAARVFFLALLVIAVIGLRASSADAGSSKPASTTSARDGARSDIPR